jgi:MFS transporter, ACS family, allantoate permease
MSMPAGAIGVVFVLSSGWLSDKLRDRSLVMFICLIPTILAGAMMIGFDPNGIPKNKGALLAASFLSGTFGASFMLLLAWNASNIAGHTKKVTTNALTLVSFALGNILGTQTFQTSQAPGYIGGKLAIIITLGLLCCAIIVLRLMNDRLNRQNAAKLAEMGEEEKRDLAEKMAFADQTDRENVFFVYTH